jgi:hypothetical protein
LVPDSILSVGDGQKVSAGDVLARLPKATSKTKDITGGLPRVANLFEARKPKDSAILQKMTEQYNLVKNLEVNKKFLLSKMMRHHHHI